MNIRRHALSVLLVICGISISCDKNDPAPHTNVVKDSDGNVYHTVTIGTQVWMLENLKTTKYRNGDPIPNITDNAEWSALKTGAYCNYNNAANSSTTHGDERGNLDPAYGRLYNWHAVNDKRNIAPEGFHVPTIEEWKELIAFIVDYAPNLYNNNGGDRMKEAGREHWECPSTEVPSCPYCKDPRNESGFTALPAGLRHHDGTFLGFGFATGLWSASLLPDIDFPAQYRYLNCFPN